MTGWTHPFQKNCQKHFHFKACVIYDLARSARPQYCMYIRRSDYGDAWPYRHRLKNLQKITAEALPLSSTTATSAEVCLGLQYRGI